ncbi:MAG TPA: ACP S-malonyltransferase, partial [Kofleriaceae bacterium]
MKSVYVFPGQGSQRRGMGAGLFERFPALVAEASAVLGYSLAELCLEDPQRVLGQTEYTQPALYAVSALTYLDRLRGGEPAPDFVAGHSLGEYGALFAAGAFDFATGLRLVQHRGALMSRAPRGAMAAVVHLELERVRELLAGLALPGIDVANINSRTQCILSGAYDELNAPALREAMTAAGGAFVPLNVSAAFHSRCMAGVQDEFARFLTTITLAPLQRTVIANCTARPYPVTGYAELLARQIVSPVRWYESMSWLIHHGHRTFQELGPGNVLSKLSDKILAEPMAIAPESTPAPAIAPPARRAGPRRVFMYGGQGTQYVQMGRQLYDTSAVFRTAFERGSAAYEAISGLSLVEAVYPERGPARGPERGPARGSARPLDD